MARFNGLRSAVALANVGISGSGGTKDSAALVMDGKKNVNCLAAVTIVTGSLQLAVKWQASDDNSTWVDVKDWNNAAYVTLTATGSVWLTAPPVSARYLRVRFLCSGATAVVTDDFVAATWKYELETF